MKVIVAHPFQQHSFKTAIAVKKNDSLYKYITTVYFKRGTWTYFLSRILKGDNLKRIFGRRSELLEEEDVIVIAEWANLILLLLQRIDKSHIIYNWWYWRVIDIFNSKLYDYIKNNDVDVVIVYDTVSASFIKKVKKNNLNIKVVVDMSAPNANYMYHIFENENKNLGLYDKKNHKEFKNSYFLGKCQAAKYEIKNADAFLVASDFTKKSLEWDNIKEKRVFKCIYGVSSNIKNDYLQYKHSRKIICVYMGTVNLQKGAYRLFEAIREIRRNDIEFHFYGYYDKNSDYYHEFSHSVFFHGHIPHSKMLKELEKSDIVIFPSFADGFGFSVTEGLVRNNIAICSTNAGVSELIVDKYNGFCYKPKNVKKLIKILNELQIDKLRIMQKIAPLSISEFTWTRYAQMLNKALENIIKESELE